MVRGVTGQWIRIGSVGVSLLGVWFGFSAPASGQMFPRRALAQRNALLPTEREGQMQVRRMLRPTLEFSGEQVTEITSGGGRTSRQRIRGDQKGRLRCDFLAPAALASDVMLIAPDSFRHYHASDRTLDVALWPTEDIRPEQIILRRLHDKQLRVERVGEEIIAGRTAIIVQVTPRRVGSMGFSAKFWIDREAGIKLKHEINNATGLVSRSYFTQITVGPEAGVVPKDFQPDFPQARVRTLFPGDAHFNSVQEAGDRLPFRPLEPATLPPNFRLSGVWVMNPTGGPRSTPAVLLRYTNGIGDFALFQRRLPLPSNELRRPLSPGGRAPVRRWRVPQSDGLIEITFLGHLPPRQAGEICNSVR